VLRRWLLVVHRWLGVTLCLFILLWFPSGIGMMYWDYPSVEPPDRLARSPALVSSRVLVSPVDALKRLGWTASPAQLLLNTYDGRPAYRFYGDRGAALVYADTGEVQFAPTADLLGRIAASWTGRPIGEARVDAVTEVDQWTLQGELPKLRPLWKYSWPDGEQVYVSGVSGEVVQYTTTASRWRAYLGPIPHWLYFTPLRKHPAAWSRTVIWTSGATVLAAIAGLVLGWWAYSPSRRYRIGGTRRHFPYRGVKNWHAAVGLAAGITVVTWAFSGMLSVDPFPVPTSRSSTGDELHVQKALRDPLTLQAFEDQGPRDALRALGNLQVAQLEWVIVGGHPAFLATLAGGGSRVVHAAGGSVEQQFEFDRRQIADLVAKGASPISLTDVHEIDRYDAYYRDRHHRLPLPVLLALFNDASRTQFYIDPRTATVVGVYSSQDWVARWLYHGLHSLDLPPLADHRPAWDIVMLTFLAGGSVVSATSLLLAWRVAKRFRRRDT
jgi:hypothetical protein